MYVITSPDMMLPMIDDEPMEMIRPTKTEMPWNMAESELGSRGHIITIMSAYSSTLRMKNVVIAQSG